jgi:hypothetical protein
MKISELVDWAENIDDDDYRYLNRGDEMNLKISKAAQNLKKVGYYLSDLMQKGYFLVALLKSYRI